MIHGSCLCRRITYRASGILGPYVYCHCQSCRKASGSAFAANVAVARSGFELLTGHDDVSAYESSPGKRRHFCRNCGSPIYTTVGPNPEVVRIRLGTLDSDFSDRPVAHIFVEENPDWHEIGDSVPQYARWPDKTELPIPGSRQSGA